MKIIYQDLLNFLAEKPSKELLSEKLFQLGHEHEISGDIFDMELTPNRGDCLSLNGLARDLSIFFKKGEPKKIYESEIDTLEIDFKNIATDKCQKISFLEIEIDANISDYKPYLEEYFQRLNHKKVNFFTDISNYLSYEVGQPTHCFDKEKISNTLIFDYLQTDNIFKTLHDKDIVLEGYNCIFQMDNQVISLAGIMGGKSTSCNAKTTKALIECAFFNPEAIIGKSTKYNLASDAAHKFERGVDINAQENTLRRFIHIVSEHTRIFKLNLKTFDYSKKQDLILNIDEQKINSILGTSLSRVDYVNYLSKLGFITDNKIKVPSYRTDIANQNDIAEEVARIIGFNNIPSKPINFLNKKNINKASNTLKLKSLLVNNGFSEVINYPFSSAESDYAIKIDNPLDVNKGYLRESLKSSLIENLIYNERRQKDSIKLFEISDIYSNNIKINQVTKLGIIASGRQSYHYTNFAKKIDNKYLGNIFESNNIQNIQFEEISRIDINSKRTDKVFYFEIDISMISLDSHNYINTKSNHTFINYEPISSMPSISRDISFAIEKPSSLNVLIDEINDFKIEHVKEFFVFDFFINSKQNIIKIGFRFIFQSKSITLNIDHVEKELLPLIEKTLIIDGVSIPGMNF